MLDLLPAPAEPLGSARSLLCLVLALLGLACVLPASAAALQFVQAPGSPYGFDSEGGSDVATGDLNGDGRDDVVTGNQGPIFEDEPSYSVLLATPQGALTLTAGGARPLPGYVGGIALGDFDADNVLDLAVALQAGGANVYLGDGSGNFSPTPIANLVTGETPSAIAAADLNDDGKEDLAVSNIASSDVSVFYGAGDGTFDQPAGSPFPVGANQPVSLAVGDFNGDAREDIATANLDETGISQKSISVLLAGGDGKYAAAPGSPLSGEYRSQAIAVGHVDAGSTLDLVTVSSPNNGIVVKLGAGDGTFTDAPGGPFYFPSRLTGALALADLNGDGRDEVSLPIGRSIGEAVNDTVWIFEPTAAGSLTIPEGNPFPVWPAQFPEAIAAGDFDADGVPDLVTTNGTADLTVLLRDDDPQPNPVMEPEWLEFGEYLVGESSGPQNVRVANDGAGPLSLSSLTVAGEDADQFSVDTSACAPVLDQGEECDVAVTFNPTRAGWMGANLQIPRALGPPAWVSLEGQAEDVASATISPTEADFGSVQAGEGPTSVETFEVENTSEVWIEIESVSIEGADADEFTIEYDDCEGADLYGAGEICEIDVSFEPQSAGEMSAELVVESAELPAPLTATLTGTGEANAEIVAYPAPWDAGTAEVGTADGPTGSITVESIGYTPLEVGTAAIVGDDPADFEIVADECAGESLEVFAECEIEVEFSPTAGGPRSAVLEIPSNASAGTYEVVLEGSGETKPDAAITPASHDFGDVPYKTASTPQVFEVESTGSEPLDVSAVELVGESDGYELLSDECTGKSVAPGESCSVEVLLRPQSYGLGAIIGTLRVLSNAPGSPTQASLTGLGVPNPGIGMTPAEHDFGGRLVGTGPSAAQEFVVESAGTTPVQIGASEITGADDEHFDFDGSGCTEAAFLAPGETCTLRVSFDPLSAGPKSAELVISTNGGEAKASLDGTGLVRALSVSPSASDFGSAPVGGSADPLSVNLENTGTAPVTIESLELSGDVSQFAVAEDCVGEIEADAACLAEVKFEPTETGLQEATLTVEANATNGPWTVQLSGTGVVEPELAVEPKTVDFGVRAVGSESPGVDLELHSVGATPVTIDSLDMVGDEEDFVIAGDDCPGSIPVGQHCSVTVVFAPESTGPKEAELQVASDDPDSPAVATLTGTGLANPGIAVEPESIVFGDTVVGSAAQALPVSIESTGTTPLELGDVTLGGAGAAQFSTSEQECDPVLAPQETCQLTVLFSPTAPGAHEATLEIASDAAGGPVTVPIAGTALPKAQPPQPSAPGQPVPSCLEPDVGRPGGFFPEVKGTPGVPGVRARFAIAGPTVLEVRGRVRYRLDGRTLSAELETRALEAAGARANYKVALPVQLRKKLRPGAAVTLKLRYRSRKADAACTAFGAWKQRSIATRVVRVRD